MHAGHHRFYTLSEYTTLLTFLQLIPYIYWFNSTEKRESTQKTQPEWENSSLGFIDQKLFISGIERCHTTLFSKVNNIQSIIPEET